MCTVTVWRRGKALLLAMNRDERRDRAPEAPPVPRAGGHEWIAPLDGASGGTWFAASSAGFAGCLLNRYQDPIPAGGGRTSRGRLLEILCTTAGSVASHPDVLRTLDLSAFAPFTLVLATRAEAARFDWNGARLRRRTLPSPLAMVTSSSWETAAVLSWRRRAFARWTESPDCSAEGIPSFHLHAPPGDACRAPMMQREASATRSITLARLDWGRGWAEVRHWPVADGRLLGESPRCGVPIPR